MAKLGLEVGEAGGHDPGEEDAAIARCRLRRQPVRPEGDAPGGDDGA
jgi:hypothetical protein